MSETIDVKKASVTDLFGNGKAFVIPEYQRPYAWTEEHVETLFEDLWEFTFTRGGSKRDGTYFLGSMVSYEREKGTFEIVDGQQRITSLFLLLRAIYTKLTSTIESERSDEARHFIDTIEPLVWRTDKLNGKVNYKEALLTSCVLNHENNEGNSILRSILESGKVSNKLKDRYSQNYLRFLELYDKHSKENALGVYDFIYAVLNQAILLPITAGSQDSALDIFSTLNDRGLPLSDADIFKAKIYNYLSDDEKKGFIKRWQDLDEQATDAGESIQQLFYYNMFYLRAVDGDTKTSTPGVRKYYAENKFARLYEPKLLDTLFKILEIWRVVNRREDIDGLFWTGNMKVRQALDTLSAYPNEYWKYPVVVYYICYKDEAAFAEKFLRFLNRLQGELLGQYLLSPTINAVKSGILKLNSAIMKSDLPKFEFTSIDLKAVSPRIHTPNRNIVRMLLMTIAYSYDAQKDLLQNKWEIEHIFPRSWQGNYSVMGRSKEEINEKIEHIGNKLPLEKKLNIGAGNGYWEKKKIAYAASNIAMVKEMCEQPDAEWNLDSIVRRDECVSDKILSVLKRWRDDYRVDQQTDSPSVEQLAQIEEFRKKGWV